MEYKELEEAGIDIASLTERLMGNKALIKRFMYRFVENENYTALERAIRNEEWKTACESSHTLKGMCGNLSMNELFNLFTRQVTLFRAGENDKACALMPRISAKYESTMQHVSKWLEE